jgi:GntR family transcriptional regulator
VPDDVTRKIALPAISPAAPGPLYAQIVAGVKREVAAGRLAAGDALPSFRALAEDLMVSLITVKRAYEELEHDGIIYRKQGLGTYVSEDGAARSRAVHRAEVAALLKQAVNAAAHAGMADEELAALLQQIQKKEEG